MDSKTNYASVQSFTPVASVVMVDVAAPATLPAGYTFDAVYDGVTFPVKVPAGGAIAGQRFSVPFTPGANLPEGGASIGKWKDGLCACTRYGICHPSFLNAWCCPLILMGQIMTRMKLDWKATPSPADEWRKTFSIVIYILIANLFVNLFFGPPPADVDENGQVTTIDTRSGTVIVIFNIVSMAFALYSIFIVCKTRSLLRERDQIPEERCGGCEDLCCTLCCGCCTVAQMARQTAGDDYYETAQCCSSTGLKYTQPTLVV